VSRVVAILVALALALATGAAAGQSSAAPAAAAPSATATLEAANRALAAGYWDGAAALLAPLDPGQLAAPDRAEVHRIRGVAAFFLGRHGDAERELVAYLRLDLDARLDPATTPPEAVTFFEDVRARHGAELRAMRPPARPRRWVGAAFLPPYGQFQNGDRTKGWVITGTGLALIGANVGSYLMLRRWCDEDTGVCPDRTDAARRMRTVNLVTGAGVAAVYLYGVIDGLVGYRAASRARVEVAPTAGGAALILSGQF
jgi:hypothetical protein